MFHYMMLPLDQHYDGGLGATGEAFEDAAKLVSESDEIRSIANIHLPIELPLSPLDRVVSKVHAGRPSPLSRDAVRE